MSSPDAVMQKVVDEWVASRDIIEKALLEMEPRFGFQKDPTTGDSLARKNAAAIIARLAHGGLFISAEVVQPLVFLLNDTPGGGDYYDGEGCAVYASDTRKLIWWGYGGESLLDLAHELGWEAWKLQHPNLDPEHKAKSWPPELPDEIPGDVVPKPEPTVYETPTNDPDIMGPIQNPEE